MTHNVSEKSATEGDIASVLARLPANGRDDVATRVMEVYERTMEVYERTMEVYEPSVRTYEATVHGTHSVNGFSTSTSN